MVAPVILVEAQPRNAEDGAAVPLRLAGLGGLYPYFYGEQHYRAGIAGLPRTIASLDFDGEQLGGGGVPQAMELRWSPAGRALLAEAASLYWADAPITVRIGPEGDAMPPIVAAGLVQDAPVEGGGLRITLSDAAADLKKALLTDRFAGTGGIEGPVELEGIIKSRAWGRCFNVPGQLIDRAANIWCFGDPRRAWQSFVQVRDRGVALTAVQLLAWQGSAEATFAALKGAAVADGGVIVCPSIACVKLWTQATGDLKADIEGETAGGYVETAPEIVARLVAVRSTIPIAAGALAEAAAWRPAPSGWRIDNDTTTAADAISELLGDVSLSWLLIGGQLRFRRWEWTASTRVAHSHRVTRRSTVKPVGTRKLGYRRNWSPMARGDLAAIVLAQDVAYEDGTGIVEAIAEAGKTAEWDKVADPTGQKPENGATVGGTIGKDVKGPAGDVLKPVEVLNSALVLRPDGTLVASIGDTVRALGKIDLIDFGAASDIARRQLESDLASMSAAIAQLAAGQQIVQTVFRDAGLYTDPASGIAKLFAIESRAEQVSKLSVTLNAALSEIGLKASVNYVNEAITRAKLDGSDVDLSSIYVRLTSAETVLSGLQASIQLKADATIVTGLQGSVTSINQSLDALNALVSTKASRTIVDALDTRLSLAETTLSAVDGASISSAVTASRRIPAEGDAAAEMSILGALTGWAGQQTALAAVAAAKTELTAKTEGNRSAIASLALQLGVQIGTVTAQIGAVQAAQVDGDRAIASDLATYKASTGDALASVNRAILAQTDKQTAMAVRLDQYDVALGDMSGRVTDERSARIDGDKVVASDLAAYKAATGDALASVNRQILAQSDRTATLAGRLDSYDASLGRLSGRIDSEHAAWVDGDSANAQSLQTYKASNDDAVSIIRAGLSTQAEKTSVLTRQYNTLTASIGDFGSVTVSQSFQALASRTGRLEGRYTLAIDVNGRLKGFVLAGSQDGPATFSFIDTDLNMGAGRVIFNNGTFMRVQGTGFGVGGEFISWFGRTMPIAQCSRANAVSYECANGDTYFGGSLSAGTFRNSSTSSTLAVDSSVVVGPFKSNGRARAIIVSYDARGDRQITTTCPSPAPAPPSVTVDLYRGGDANGTALASQTFTGTYSCDDGFGPNEPGTQASAISGSFTFTDNQAGDSFTYFARIRGRSLVVDPQRQLLSLISTEQ